MIGKTGMALVDVFRAARAPRRADQDRRRQARAGRHFFDRAELRYPGSHVAGLYACGRPNTICVNDPSSPAYNTIASRARIGPSVRAENMSRALPMYRRGLLLDYPTDARRRSRIVHFHPRLGRAGQRLDGLRRHAASPASRRCRILPPMARCWQSCRPARWIGCEGCLPQD